MEQIRFTTHVLGAAAAYKLEKHQVTQTLRAESSSIVNSIINRRASTRDKLEIILDNIIAGHAKLTSMDAVAWASIDFYDAHCGGFNNLDDLEAALKRAGFRFKPIDRYLLYRIQFVWLDEAYA